MLIIAFAATREVAFDRNVFGDAAVLFARNVGRGNVNQPGIQQLHQLDDVQCAVNIRLERLIHRRIEIHDAGEIHHNIDFAFE